MSRAELLVEAHWHLLPYVKPLVREALDTMPDVLVNMIYEYAAAIFVYVHRFPRNIEVHWEGWLTHGWCNSFYACITVDRDHISTSIHSGPMDLRNARSYHLYRTSTPHVAIRSTDLQSLIDGLSGKMYNTTGEDWCISRYKKEHELELTIAIHKLELTIAKQIHDSIVHKRS
jgi:hypothetical protein